MLKLKNKSNFSFIIIINFLCFVFPDGYFLDSEHENVLFFSSNYTKHIDLKDYNISK